MTILVVHAANVAHCSCDIRGALSFTDVIARVPFSEADEHTDACRKVATRKYGQKPTTYMSARLAAGYYSPEDQYEATVERLVTGDSSWLDVGCGRAPFPNNLALAEDLSRRCCRFVGIDPDPSVNENRFVHERYQLSLDQFYPDCTFDLVTARMVVEHLADASSFIRDLSRITKPGSAVVIFTVNWWSLTTLVAHLSPFFIHHGVKRLLWNTSRRDTFPTEYKLNRLHTLSSAMIDSGFHEHNCRVIPDASLFWRVPLLRNMEVNCFRLFKRLRIPYIDSCILAIYERRGQFGQ